MCLKSKAKQKGVTWDEQLDKMSQREGRGRNEGTSTQLFCCIPIQRPARKHAIPNPVQTDSWNGSLLYWYPFNFNTWYSKDHDWSLEYHVILQTFQHHPPSRRKSLLCYVQPCNCSLDAVMIFPSDHPWLTEPLQNLYKVAAINFYVSRPPSSGHLSSEMQLLRM